MQVRELLKVVETQLGETTHRDRRPPPMKSPLPSGTGALVSFETDRPYTKDEIFYAIARVRESFRLRGGGGPIGSNVVVPQFVESMIVAALPTSGEILRQNFSRYACMVDLILKQLRTSSGGSALSAKTDDDASRRRRGRGHYTAEDVRHAGAALRLLMSALADTDAKRSDDGDAANSSASSSIVRAANRCPKVSVELIESVARAARSNGIRMSVPQMQATFGSGDTVRALINDSNGAPSAAIASIPSADSPST